ncbi:hypothetical protein [Streptomyces sp. NRRL S-646]|uniref:hypothetical protein n=1 Tax=Streptomyces sp. NRRL S-646 TaxID=1463917 RepID=UPI0004C6BFF1|nr:hypothetical protein [Streptomyces sp. NRRL S-646]
MGVLRELVISVAGSAIFLMLVWVVSRTARQATVLIVTRVLGLDLEQSFKDAAHVAEDLQAELARARWVTVMTSRGNDLQRHVFADTLRAASAGTKRVRILLPDPDAVGPPDWIDVRETETGSFDHAYRSGLLRLQIRQNISYLAAHAASGRMEMRLYNQPHIARIVLTDRVVYLTQYEDTRHGQLSPVKKYRRGDMYDYLCRTVALTWDHARQPSGAP